MTANDVYKRLMEFIENDFCHLRDKVDKLFWIIVSGLVAIVGGLIALLVK